MQKVLRVIRYTTCFPYVIYLGWKKEEDFNSGNWGDVVKNLLNIRWFGGLSPRDLFLLGYAYSSLGEFAEALNCLVMIQAPLEDIDEEACRYCTHIWLLHKLGKTDEAKAVLDHSKSEKWPANRLEWVKAFLKSIKSGSLSNGNDLRPSLSAQ
jgi:tetratricopeptide (TPR) repeat protein